MELNPFGRWTVKIATRSTMIIGAAARGTKAPKRISSPPTISTAIVATPASLPGHADGLQNRNERVRTSIKLCVAVFDEAETESEPERQGVPACRDWKLGDGKLAKSGGEFHTCRFAAAVALVSVSLLTFQLRRAITLPRDP